MKRAKAILSALLVLAMTLSMAACTKSATQSSSSSSASGKYGKHLVISIAGVDFNSALNYNSGDDFAKYWTDKFNFEWNIMNVTYDDWAQKIAVWTNAGNLPDFVTWNPVASDMVNYMKQGLVYKLPSGWKTKWPNVAKAYTDSVLGPKLEAVVGGAYCLPKPIFTANKPADPVVDHFGVVMRQDWMDAVGFPKKDYYKWSELAQYYQLLLDKDPGKVGKKLIPCALGPDDANCLFVRNNSTNSGGDSLFYKNDDNSYKWGAADDDTLTGLQLYQEFYRKGYLSKDFYTDKSQYDEFFTTGVAGMCYQDTMAKAFASNAAYGAKNGITKDKMHFAYILGEDNYYHANEVKNFYTVNIFSPTIAKEKFERLMDLMDYSATKEGQYIIRMGFKGKDWDTDSNGNLKSLMKDNAAVDSVYPTQYPLYNRLLVLSDDFSMINPQTSQEYRDTAMRFYKNKVKQGNSKTIARVNWNKYFYTSDAVTQASAINYTNEYTQLILKSGDLKSNWQSWITSKNNLIQPVLKELAEKVK